MPNQKRERVDRRTDEDRRQLYDLNYFEAGNPERRILKERRDSEERRGDWVRLGRWFSVHTESLVLQ